MAKVKPPFLSELRRNYAKWQDNVIPVKWNTIAEEIIKKKKDSLKSDPSKSKAPKPLKIKNRFYSNPDGYY
jgi:hypothetical protein